MRSKFFWCGAALSLSMIVGCGASLSRAGASVRYVMREEAPSTCEYVEEVSSGEGVGEATSLADLKTHLRNETAIQRGNFLVIDTWERMARYGANGLQHYYVGTGRAYRCDGRRG